MAYSPDCYLNRELSWLEFNQRVLDLSMHEQVPLLERVKFLAITASNLDEFFKVRVGGLRLAQESEIEQLDIAGMTIHQQLDAITGRVREMNDAQSSILRNQLLPQLQQAGIERLAADQLSEDQFRSLETIFDEEISACIAPITIDGSRPFPLMANANLGMCIRLRFGPDETLCEFGSDEPTDERFAIISIGPTLKRVINLPQQDGVAFMFVEDVIGLFLDRIFPSQEILEWVPFRMTRNADIGVNDDAMHDLLKEMTQLLQARKISNIVRLEVASRISEDMLSFLQVATVAGPELTFSIDAPLDLTGLFELASIPGYPKLKDTPWPPQPSPEFAEQSGDIFETIAEADRVLIHPYQQFEPVVELLQAAAEDPNVIAIKQTLYRTSRDSAIIEALIQAAANGKQVTAIVELKARFDEARNIFGARRLEQAGVDVIYGVQGLKTHAKICIVVRRENRGIQRYVHFGTGNYNESTAKLYSDISYFTNNEQLGSDAILFFNAITGLSVPQPMQLLAAAPIDLKETVLDLIQVETEIASQGGASEINAKLNSLVDQDVIDALYAASNAGVKIRLNVRGICCLRPGVPDLSENIEVISIVDRLLEHARVFHFYQAGENRVFISSADWMGRNLNRRAELFVPIEDESCRGKILASLKSYFRDNVRTSVLQSDGSYRAKSSGGDEPFRVQKFLYDQACESYAAFSNPKATVFKAHRGESA
ncbi:MAG: polyphosphate kinase 1 [Planctomycetota bacterium]